MLLRTLTLLAGLMLASGLLAADGWKQIEQAEKALAAGKDRAAERILSRIKSGSLDAVALARLQIVRAELALKRGKSRGALHALPRTSDHVPDLAPRIELLRGRGWFMEGNPVYAVRVLTQRERFLKSEQAIQENHDAIWAGLIAAPIPPSTLTNLDKESRATRGWIELALVMQNGVDPSALQAWQRKHSRHPATKLARGLGGGTIVGELADTGEQNRPSPQDTAYAGARGAYALLLPTSGRLALAGQAVRDGFVSAWFDSRQQDTPIRVYDTGSDPARAVAALSEAQRDGASMIVGPIDRASIQAIAQQQPPAAPWLALNYVDGLVREPLQFGLAPQDEALAAAQDALAQGYRTALILAPANRWGNRAVDAFQQAFELEGGTVLETVRYPLERRDLTRPLQSLFGVDDAKKRNRELDQILGERTSFEARTRTDAHFLYAPMRAREALTLRLKLKFIDAPSLPVYMLSAAHQGHLSSQLGGIRLCDMPWVLQETGYWIARRERASNDFPELVRSQPRLFAFGSDAFQIAQRVQARRIDAQAIDAATGQLRLSGRRFERLLACHSLPEPEPEFSEEALAEEDSGSEAEL